MSGHVFISHASENRDEANAIVALIEAKGMTAWIAPRDVRPGFDYSEELQRALENCAAFVVLVTAEANTSPYVRAETEMAFSNQKPMLPVRLGDVAAGPGLAFFLKIRHWTDAWGPQREAALARLVLELQTLTGTAPSWAPKAGPSAAPAPAESPPAESPPPAAAPPSPMPVAPPPLARPSAPSAAPDRTRLLLVAGLIAAVVLVAIIFFLTRRVPAPTPGPQVNGFTPAPTTPTPTPTPPPAQARGYADELADFGVPAKGELESNVGSPTPLTIPIGVRVTTAEVQRMMGENSAFIIDVLATPHPQTLPGAFYMPVGGQPGSFADANQAQFAQQLSEITAGDTSKPLIFFCQGANCWESYNAALRANAAGYSQVFWYRGGLAAWQEAGLQMLPLTAPYGSAPGAD